MARKRINSTYSPVKYEEERRLQIQAMQTSWIDSEGLNEAYEGLADEGLVVLDYGCAQGFVAQDRFGNDPRVEKVICVDVNKEAIEKANAIQQGGEGMLSEKLRFYCLENGDNPLKELSEILVKEECKSIDIVFLALVLHHTKRPIAILKDLREIMTPGGYVFARTPEDGSKMAFPDGDNLVVEICRRHAASPKASDRYHGRKLYGQFKKAGLENVHVSQFCMETSNRTYEQRQAMFDDVFSYRINVFKTALEKSPNDKKAQEEYQWMKNALEELEDLFMEDSFWFCYFEYTALGRKPL